MITDVTIISNNLHKKLINEYKDYTLVGNNFNYQDLKNYKKIIFFLTLDNLAIEEVRKLFEYLRDNNILFINITNNIEHTLCTDYLTIYENSTVIKSGKTKEVLLDEKLFKHLGIKRPFIIELSTYLNDYDLIQDIYFDKESLVSKLWN